VQHHDSSSAVGATYSLTPSHDTPSFGTSRWPQHCLSTALDAGVLSTRIVKKLLTVAFPALLRLRRQRWAGGEKQQHRKLAKNSSRSSQEVATGFVVIGSLPRVELSLRLQLAIGTPMSDTVSR
jgi:hypothetical protein